MKWKSKEEHDSFWKGVILLVFMGFIGILVTLVEWGIIK